MRVPRDWPLLAVALTAAGLAIYAGPNVPAAIGFGLLATVAAALLLVAPMRRLARPPTRTTPPAVPAVPASLIESFRAGAPGREEILQVLDRIDRSGPRPGLPIATPEEISRVRSMGREEFRSYVRERLTAIEGEVW